jgi:integrase
MRKHGIASVHPLRGPELRILRRLQRDYPHSAYVFVSERKAPLTADAVRKVVGRAGSEAGIEFKVHPHMMRHATGYKLANDWQDMTPSPLLRRPARAKASSTLALRCCTSFRMWPRPSRPSG